MYVCLSRILFCTTIMVGTSALQPAATQQTADRVLTAARVAAQQAAVLQRLRKAMQAVVLPDQETGASHEHVADRQCCLLRADLHAPTHQAHVNAWLQRKAVTELLI